MKVLTWASLIMVPLFLGGCKSTGHQKVEVSIKAPAEDSNLTRKEAAARSTRVSQVAYELKVRLNATDTTFKGSNEITFELSDPSTPLRLDFFEGQVRRLLVNGQNIGAAAKRAYQIDLPAFALKKGKNTVQVDFEQAYSTQGQGLHRFVDPETKDIFLYSQFETFDANRFFPCFDQPDLKATLRLSVEAPAKWEVITTAPEVSVTKQGGKRLWVFEKTPRLSTYVFSLHAGPYKVWRDRYEDLPLRLFARPSMAKYVRAQEWFLWTKQGLRYFNNFFALPYPFKKYDQLFVPEFNAGAMENVGAVTFTENFLARSELTRDDRRRRASVLLHEMAHMWFGDIVTMKWWNDLWLNESFATIMSALALVDATDFKEEWLDFFAGDKTSAYWNDALITTHPIEAPVNSVKEAFATFDGITYGKGAAVIKQLRAYIGADAYRAGVRDYMKEHAFGNAELKDFIKSLQTHTPRDLNLWAERWLRQSGTDKIAAEWTCQGAELKEIQLSVTPSSGAKFRPQVVHVGLFKSRGGRVERATSIPVDLTSERQAIKGPWPCPDIVYPNDRDEGYLAVRLDLRSLKNIVNKLAQVEDDLTRTMLWHDVWQMVRDSEIPLQLYVDLLKRHFPMERNTILLNRIVGNVVGRWSEQATVLYYWPTDEKSLKERDQFVAAMEKNFLDRFKSAVGGSDAQKFWFDRYVSLARTPSALDQLARWSTEKKVGPGLPLDLDRKWNLALQLSRFAHPAAPTLLETLKEEDRSDRGARRALAAEAIQPTFEVKQKWFERLATPKPNMSFASARSVMGALFPAEQSAFAKRLEESYYNYLKANGRDENEVFVTSFAGSAAPLNCAESESQRLKSFIDEKDRFSPTVLKTLLMSLDEDERCQKIRARNRGEGLEYSERENAH